jgi:hypothetical protein
MPVRSSFLIPRHTAVGVVSDDKDAIERLRLSGRFQAHAWMVVKLLKTIHCCLLFAGWPRSLLAPKLNASLVDCFLNGAGVRIRLGTRSGEQGGGGWIVFSRSLWMMLSGLKFFSRGSFLGLDKG